MSPTLYRCNRCGGHPFDYETGVGCVWVRGPEKRVGCGVSFEAAKVVHVCAWCLDERVDTAVGP